MAEENEIQLLNKFRMLIKESELNETPFTDELLICFIRARKNDLDRALSSLKNYKKMSKRYPDLFTGLTLRRLQPTLEVGHFLVSPSREQNGRRVLIIKNGHWDVQKCSLDDCFRCLLYTLQRLASETDTQTNGLILIFDYNGFSISQVRHFTPGFMKKLADLLQNVFPVRLQGIHITHEPWVFKILLSMIWPFLSRKMRSRIYTHGNKFDNLHHFVDPSCLPSEYEGSQGPMDRMNASLFVPDQEKNIFEDLKF